MWRILWFLWLVVIFGLTVLPLSNFVGHSHWDLVTWIPYSEHHLAIEDIVGNIALFLPFGFFLSRSLPTSSRNRVSLLAVVMAAVLSTAVEFFQVYCHNRNPSTTDICNNALGAGLGVWLATSHL